MIALVDLAASRQRENPSSNPVYCIAQVQVAASELGVGLDKWQPIDLAYPPPKRFVCFVFKPMCLCQVEAPAHPAVARVGCGMCATIVKKKGGELLQ